MENLSANIYTSFGWFGVSPGSGTTNCSGLFILPLRFPVSQHPMKHTGVVNKRKFKRLIRIL